MFSVRAEGASGTASIKELQTDMGRQHSLVEIDVPAVYPCRA